MGIVLLEEDNLTPQTQCSWDEYVSRQPLSSFYHLYNWKFVLREAFGFRPFYLLYKEDSLIKGVCPLFLMRDIFRKKYLISNPFANFAGILADNKHTEIIIIDYIKELSKKFNVEYSQLRGKGNIIDSENNCILTKDYFVTLCLDLSPGENGLWERLGPRNRNKIRTAEKSGFSVDAGNNCLSEFYAVFAKNMLHLGTPSFPVYFFAKILEHFPNNTNIFVIKYNGIVVSGMFLFWFKDIISEPWVSSLRSYNKYYINNFLYWEAIKFAIVKGFKYFDFGRSTRGSGTYNFKEQWGAEASPLTYQYILGRAKNVADVNARENKYGLFINIWKRLPEAVSNFVGPKIVRYLPEL